jgi:nucleotide-binding universal stress UspA family protein
MDRALVVVDDTEQHRRLLREAGELAAGVGARLFLYSPMTEEEYESNYDTMESIAEIEGTGYGEGSVVEAAIGVGENLAEDVFDDIDVDYRVIGEVIDENVADAVIETAEERGCDHVFVRGRRRSPTGKAVFGDTAQAVILNFDGFVTVATA